jgi:hypothetical protein
VKPDDSHIDEMREAVRGDFERSRRSSVLSQQLAGDVQAESEPELDEARHDGPVATAEPPRRFRLWRR